MVFAHTQSASFCKLKSFFPFTSQTPPPQYSSSIESLHFYGKIICYQCLLWKIGWCYSEHNGLLHHYLDICTWPGFDQLIWFPLIIHSKKTSGMRNCHSVSLSLVFKVSICRVLYQFIHLRKIRVIFFFFRLKLWKIEQKNYNKNTHMYLSINSIRFHNYNILQSWAKNNYLGHVTES